MVSLYRKLAVLESAGMSTLLMTVVPSVARNVPVFAVLPRETAVALGALTLYWTISRVRTPATRLPVSLAVFPFHVLDDGGVESELGLGLADGVIA